VCFTEFFKANGNDNDFSDRWRAYGFKNWSVAHPPAGADNDRAARRLPDLRRAGDGTGRTAASSMARTRTEYPLKHSIAQLLDDPIARLLMKSDGVDRAALERLVGRIAHSLKFGHGDRDYPHGLEQI
jgi:hypothetical protein